MSSTISAFPEELLHNVVEYVASDVVFIERQISMPSWKYARAALISLSMVNHQLRRICFSFLFAYIELKGVDNLERFVNQCLSSETFALSIRTLCLDAPSDFGEFARGEIFCHLLDHLPNLSRINLNAVSVDKPLLTAINRHPQVSTVISSSMAVYPEDDLGSLDLAKIIFDSAKLYGAPHWATEYFACGMRIRHLSLDQPSFLTESPGAWNFQGLHEITINLDHASIPLSWIPDFTRAHPLLKKISFSHFRKPANYKRNPTVEFVQPFLEVVLRQQLDDCLNIKGFAVTRIEPGGEPAVGPFGEWYVTGLHIFILKWSEGCILRFAHSAFPRITTLTVRTIFVPFDEIVDSLVQFTSLKVVSFIRPFNLLEFGVHLPSPAETEAAMIEYTSHLAQQMPTIEAFYISALRDMGNSGWSLRGWLNVQTLPGIEGPSRHTVGPLCYEVGYDETSSQMEENHKSTPYFDVPYYI
ncbi:hypothetical protein BT96DRAFT_923846 [Gymnopus androsaceus JB14]|uniref:Uncharacterized protein n=1 Tax=Gymnopus androsaceus JB14 TaxID=1447944 RepID=A0A6A4H7Y1_9AGAR|nr:hypothetical protein BT96DRAFT_923846 [Gymnopus androsaceus JB14]